jgi:predicted permease
MWFSRRKQREQELERELQAHLDLEAEERTEAGMSYEEARFAAKRALGNEGLTKEDVRAAWGWTFVETLGQDLRYAFRSLRGSPVFALVAILSLGLGIGANTAIFSFVNALLFKHLPVPDADRLVTLSEYRNGKHINDVFSLPMIAELDKRNQAFDGLLGRYPVRVSLNTDHGAEPLNGEVVTGKYFTTLQVKPALGRLLNDDDDVQAGTGNPVCVISYALWQARFGGDPHILGRTLLLSAHPYSVVGVTEKGFFGPQMQSRIDLQIPVSRAGDFMNGPFVTMLKSSNFTWLEPLARLKPGLTLRRAEAMVNPLCRALRLELVDPSVRSKIQMTTFRLFDGSQGMNVDDTYFKPVTILMGVVGLVLLIACANVANLLLARAGSRATEFAVRLSLGASRGRLVRQLMVESLVLACAGCAVGLALAYWMIHTLSLYLNAGKPSGNFLQVRLDPLMIGFAILLSLLTAVVFGLAPAWQSTKPEIVPELKKAQGQMGNTGAKMRRFLVVAEIALSMMILFAAGLMTRTLGKLKTIDLGFDPGRVVMLRVDPRMSGDSPEQSDSAFDDILTNLRAQPGISAASMAVVTPLEGGMISMDFEVPGRPPKSSDLQSNMNAISPDYFKTLSQAMLAGRDFNDRDVKKSPHVAIVNELFVKQYIPGENPLGRHIKMGDNDVEIVGLVKNSFYQDIREKMSPLIYLPVKQTNSSGYSILVRTALPAKIAVAEIQRAVQTVDAKLPIYGVQQMQEMIDQGITSERMLTFLATLFSVLVTLLCGMGLYGLIAYAVSRRTREIGVRFAVGARKSDVAKLFLRESTFLIGLGVLAGVPLALASARMLKSLLFGVSEMDGGILFLTVAIFLTAGVLASLLPLRKAIRIEPLQALRYE